MVLYATEEGYRPTAALLFHSVCNRTLAVYEAGIRDHPDLAAEFMSFLSQVRFSLPFTCAEPNCFGPACDTC